MQSIEIDRDSDRVGERDTETGNRHGLNVQVHMYVSAIDHQSTTNAVLTSELAVLLLLRMLLL